MSQNTQGSVGSNSYIIGNNTNIKNTGQVVMVQTFAVSLAAGAVAAAVQDVVIPANSQIIDCVIDGITAANTGTNISVGDTVGGAATLVNTFGIGTTAGRKYPTTESGGALAWEDVGTKDIRLTFTSSATTNAGEVRVSVLYQQNTNLA